MTKRSIIGAALLASVAVAAYGSTVPFSEDFEGYGVGVDFNTSNNWATTDVESGSGVTGRALGSSVANSGSRGGAITNADLVNTFSDNQTVVFSTFYTRPYFGPEPDIPADASVAFYVNDSGTVVAYSNETAVTLSHTPIASNTYVKFTVAADYGGTPSYSLFLDDNQIASGFAFFSTSNTDFNAFQVRADSGTNVTYVDDIDIGLSNPFFQIVSNPVAGTDVTLFVGDASQNASYKVVGQDDGAGSFNEVTTAVNSGGANPFPITDTTFSGSSAETRVYKIVDSTGSSETTNDTMWIANKQARGSNQWHMVALPGHFGTPGQDALNSDAGAELAKLVDHGPNKNQTAQIYAWTGAWHQIYLSTNVSGDKTWYNDDDDVAATRSIDPGDGIWLKTYLQGAQTAILTGQGHTGSSQVTMYASSWNLFSWPYATPEANSANGWGFSNGTFTAGTSWDDSSRILMQDGNQFYNLWLSAADGLWKIQDTTQTAPVSLRAGKAYYFYNPSASATYTAAPSN